MSDLINGFHIRSCMVACAVAFSILIPLNGWAQKVDVFLKAGSPVRGELKATSPEKISVDTNDGVVDVDVKNIRSMAFSDEPTEMSSARKRFDDGRYDDGLAELSKLTSPPKEKFLVQELAYLRAVGNAGSLFNGGKVTANEAGKVVLDFTTSFPTSHHYLAMVESLGQLYLSIGRNDLAKNEFQKLAECSLPDVQLKGNFLLGQTQLALGDAANAEKSFSTVVNWPDASESVQGMKVLAQPMIAKAMALGDKGDQARAIVEKLIAEQSIENQELFAACYNVLGICDFRKGDFKSAALHFLHTDLLFRVGDTHAEALYYLAEIWPKLEKSDLALEARESLKRLYPNSAWNAKLNK